MPDDLGRSSNGPVGRLIDALRGLMAREALPESAPAPRRRRPSLWRMLLEREVLPTAPSTQNTARADDLLSMLLAREQLPPPPPPSRSGHQSLWRMISSRERLPEEGPDVR